MFFNKNKIKLSNRSDSYIKKIIGLDQHQLRKVHKIRKNINQMKIMAVLYKQSYF